MKDICVNMVRKEYKESKNSGKTLDPTMFVKIHYQTEMIF